MNQFAEVELAWSLEYSLENAHEFCDAIKRLLWHPLNVLRFERFQHLPDHINFVFTFLFNGFTLEVRAHLIKEAVDLEGKLALQELNYLHLFCFDEVTVENVSVHKFSHKSNLVLNVV